MLVYMGKLYIYGLKLDYKPINSPPEKKINVEKKIQEVESKMER